jgi:hypothetical protein
MMILAEQKNQSRNRILDAAGQRLRSEGPDWAVKAAAEKLATPEE